MLAKPDLEQIVGTIREVIASDRRVALHEPLFDGNEWQYVKECLDTRWVSSAGAYVQKFEQGLVDYTGADYAVAVVNGTAALHIALKLAGVTEGSEVLIPALTFIATANAVAYCGAIPHFVDSDFLTMGIDVGKLDRYLYETTRVEGDRCININTGRPITAVVPVHTFGHPVDMDPLVELCAKYNLAVVEDAAESLGSFYKGKHTGNWGLLSSLSFNGNKVVTTGGGGAILTNDKKLAELAKHITTTAKLQHRWAFYHDMVGYNYRMPNINAALGCAQLEQLPDFIRRKRGLAKRYQEAFKEVSGVKVFRETRDSESNYWLNLLLLDAELTTYRDELVEYTNDQGIGTRPAWNLMNTLPMFLDCPAMDLGQAKILEKQIINLPSSVDLYEE